MPAAAQPDHPKPETPEDAKPKGDRLAALITERRDNRNETADLRHQVAGKDGTVAGVHLAGDDSGQSNGGVPGSKVIEHGVPHVCRSLLVPIDACLCEVSLQLDIGRGDTIEAGAQQNTRLGGNDPDDRRIGALIVLAMNVRPSGLLDAAVMRRIGF